MFILLILFYLRSSEGGGSSSSNSSICTENSKFNIGCLQETLIPLEKIYVVKFEDDVRIHPPPITCSKTCALFYPNTSLALVSTSGPNKDQLGCYCASEDLVDQGYFGPDIFCKDKCKGFPNYLCGGDHIFNEESSPTKYFSIYCIGRQEAPLSALPIDSSHDENDEINSDLSPESSSYSTGSSSEDDSINKIMDYIVQENVVAIVIIGLLVTILIILCVIFGWGYVFFEGLEDNTNPVKSAFYRKLSAKKSSDPLKSSPNGGSVLDYGGTDNANFSLETKNEILSGGGDDSTSNDETSKIPAVQHEGKSKFYNGNI